MTFSHNVEVALYACVIVWTTLYAALTVGAWHLHPNAGFVPIVSVLAIRAFFKWWRDRIPDSGIR
jgi:cytochrome b subunit of formate dehydrogenase